MIEPDAAHAGDESPPTRYAEDPPDMILKIAGRPNVLVKTLVEASERYCELRDEANEGASDFPDGAVYHNNKHVGRISYNGRVWAPGPWKESDAPLYDNRLKTSSDAD